jgi:hypothetical protein
MEALGREFDLSVGAAPYDTNAAASTGKRVKLGANANGVSIVLFKGAGTGTDVPVLTFKQHTASSGGTSANLATIKKWRAKSATTLAGTETWVENTQAAAATVTLTGEATKQGIYVFEIDADQLDDGYGYVSVDVADTGAAGAQLGGVLYILRDLMVQRDPASLAASLA